MKKILGKLFGGGKEEPETAPHNKHVQRSPRVRIPLLEGSSFVMANGKSYPLRNLSESGLALLAPGEKFPEEASGELRVGTERVAVKIAVVRRNGDECGATINDGAAGVRALLRRAFSDEFKALEMTEVDSSKQKSVEVGTPKWFYTPENYELFYVMHEGKLLRFELEWKGNFLALTPSNTLRFGLVEHDNRENMSHARASLVKWADTVPREHKVKALRIIENIAGLENDVRKILQGILS
jgi:hypothetical protein